MSVCWEMVTFSGVSGGRAFLCMPELSLRFGVHIFCLARWLKAG